MRAEDIIRQLQAVLPKQTNSFTDNFSVTSLTRNGTTVTAITVSPHLLATDDYAFILGAENPITISSLTQVGGVASVITAEDHDLTLAPEEVALGIFTDIEITGAIETDYNGTHRLLSVPNRREFTYQIVTTAPVTATGSPILIQSGAGYNGWYETTVVDTTTFSYETNYTPNSPAIGTIEARLRPRISGVVDTDALMGAYTKKPPGHLWAFVVVGDKVANKSRNVTSDATSIQGRGAEYRQLVIQPFGVYCLFPSTESIVGRQERDAADDLVLPFLKSLLRVKFPTGFAEDPFSGVTFSTDRFIGYNNAVYIHEYAFETTAWITYGDTTDPEDNVAFRDIYLNFETNLSETAEVVMTAKVDLDEEQLT